MRHARWRLLAAAAAAAGAGGAGALVRRRGSARSAPHTSGREPQPPLTTQSSPGQIADLQQAYGADMVPPADPRA